MGVTGLCMISRLIVDVHSLPSPSRQQRGVVWGGGAQRCDDNGKRALFSHPPKNIFVLAQLTPSLLDGVTHHHSTTQQLTFSIRGNQDGGVRGTTVAVLVLARSFDFGLAEREILSPEPETMHPAQAVPCALESKHGIPPLNLFSAPTTAFHISCQTTLCFALAIDKYFSSRP